jgi:hypothetical protein
MTIEYEVSGPSRLEIGTDSQLGLDSLSFLMDLTVALFMPKELSDGGFHLYEFGDGLNIKVIKRLLWNEKVKSYTGLSRDKDTVDEALRVGLKRLRIEEETDYMPNLYMHLKPGAGLLVMSNIPLEKVETYEVQARTIGIKVAYLSNDKNQKLKNKLWIPENQTLKK